jgi:hypothetical protein
LGHGTSRRGRGDDVRDIDYEMEDACARVHAALADLGWPVPAGRELRPVLMDRWWWLVYPGVDATDHVFVPGFTSPSDTFNELLARVRVAADLLAEVAQGVKK